MMYHFRSTFDIYLRAPVSRASNRNQRAEIFWDQLNLFDLFRIESHFLTYLTLTIDAHITRFVIACRAIDHLGFVTIVKSFATWHTIQFARIRRLRVRHPFIVNTFKWYPIEVCTLCGSKVAIGFGAILNFVDCGITSVSVWNLKRTKMNIDIT